MPTLYVDCQNTLLLASTQFAAGSDTWQTNWDVVAAIERWQQQGTGNVVLWSERGYEDAERWRRRVLPHLPGIECLAKDARLPVVSDVLIDDVPLNAKGTRYTPEQSFMVAPAPASRHAPEEGSAG